MCNFSSILLYTLTTTWTPNLFLIINLFLWKSFKDLGGFSAAVCCFLCLSTLCFVLFIGLSRGRPGGRPTSLFPPFPFSPCFLWGSGSHLFLRFSVFWFCWLLYFSWVRYSFVKYFMSFDRLPKEPVHFIGYNNDGQTFLKRNLNY